jgi:FtsH-binding integral membrane protein
MGMISAYYNIESVFLAIGITSFVCLGITAFSFQTKFDFTSCFGILFAISLALMGFGFACIFTYSKVSNKKTKEMLNMIEIYFF